VTIYADDTATNTTILNLVADINQALHAPAVKSGVIAGSFAPGSDVTFSIKINDGSPVAVTALATDMAGNTSLSDLIADVNKALTTSGLAGLVTAKPSGTGSFLGQARIKFEGSADSVNKLELIVPGSNALALTSAVATNFSGRLQADSTGNKLILSAVDSSISAFQISAAAGLPELGLDVLGNGPLVADSVDFAIYISNPGAEAQPYKVTLDKKMTIQDVIDAITDATGGDHSTNTPGKVTAAVNAGAPV